MRFIGPQRVGGIAQHAFVARGKWYDQRDDDNHNVNDHNAAD
jgi:hypothetical protein